MAKKALLPRPRNGGTMTEAAFYGKIRSVLRRGFMYWTPMMQALEAVKRKSQSSNKLLKWEYFCKKCKKWHPRKNINIDHVNSVGSLLSLDDIPNFIRNLTPEDITAYQILCKKCHQAKTNQERHGRTKKGHGIRKLQSAGD